MNQFPNWNIMFVGKISYDTNTMTTPIPRIGESVWDKHNSGIVTSIAYHFGPREIIVTVQ